MDNLPPNISRAHGVWRWFRKLTISDVSGFVATVVSIYALKVSLHVFAVQESEQANSAKVQDKRYAAESKLETASNNLLYSVNQLLNGEQRKLQRVASDLDAAHTVLGQLRANAGEEVSKLQQANAALGEADQALSAGLKAANAQLGIDSKIKSVTSAQYALLQQEHKDEVARETAEPKLAFDIEYDSGLQSIFGNPSAVAKHMPVWLTVGPELNLSLAVQVKNIGNGPLQTPTFLIENSNGTAELGGGPTGCEALNIHVLQCDNSRTLFPGRSYKIPFSMVAPKVLTDVRLAIKVESAAPRLGSADPSGALWLYIIPPPQPPSPTPVPVPTPSHH